MNATKRMTQYLDKKGITKYRFCKKTGFSNGILDKNRNLGSDKCEIISRFYPDINMTWLITGRGEMLKSCEKNYLIDLREFFTFETLKKQETLNELRKKIVQYITNNYNVDGGIVAKNSNVAMGNIESNNIGSSIGSNDLKKELELKDKIINQLQERLKDKDAIIELMKKQDK